MFEWLGSILGNFGTVKDAMTDPVQTSGKVTESLVRRLNPAVQRIVVLVLLLLALILGADIGIDYQQSKLTATPPAQGTTVNPKLPPAEPIKAQELWTPTLEPLTLPEAVPAPSAPRRVVQGKTRHKAIRVAKKQNARVRVSATRRKPIVIASNDAFRVYRPPLGQISSSGPGGY